MIDPSLQRDEISTAPLGIRISYPSTSPAFRLLSAMRRAFLASDASARDMGVDACTATDLSQFRSPSRTRLELVGHLHSTRMLPAWQEACLQVFRRHAGGHCRVIQLLTTSTRWAATTSKVADVRMEEFATELIR